MWASFTGVTGGAAAAFTTLAFIVVAIRAEAVTGSQELRARVGQTFTSALTALTGAILLSLPQSLLALGVELITAAVVAAIVLTVFDVRARRARDTSPGIGLLLATALALGAIVILEAAAGLVMVLGSTWGHFLYSASALTALLWAVFGAWSFVIGPS